MKSKYKKNKDPRKYNISMYLMEIKYQLGSEASKAVVSNILKFINKGEYTLRDYRTARINQEEKRYTCSISDMTAILSCINNAREYASKLTLKDLYHEKEWQKIKPLFTLEKQPMK